MKSKIKVHKQGKPEEYGMTPKQVERAYVKISAEIKRERCAGKLRPWRS
jgi:hypothetical protein